MTDPQSYAQLISERLQELGVRLHDIDEELHVPKPKDWEEQAIDIEDDEVLEGLGIAAQKEVRLLKQALARIGKGTYGQCKNCGEQISDERLQAVPYAVVCKKCMPHA